jgi:hypothetical protein
MTVGSVILEVPLLPVILEALPPPVILEILLIKDPQLAV